MADNGSCVGAQVSSGGPDRARALLTPVLRCVGNIAAGGGSNAIQQILTSGEGFELNHGRLILPHIEWQSRACLGLQSTERQTGGSSDVLAICFPQPCCQGMTIYILCAAAAAVPALCLCAQSQHRGLQKEALWALGSVTGSPGLLGVAAVQQAGGVPVLVSLLKGGAFDVRKEAAFALANVTAGVTRDSPAQENGPCASLYEDAYSAWADAHLKGCQSVRKARRHSQNIAAAPSTMRAMLSSRRGRRPRRRAHAQPRVRQRPGGREGGALAAQVAVRSLGPQLRRRANLPEHVTRCAD